MTNTTLDYYNHRKKSPPRFSLGMFLLRVGHTICWGPMGLIILAICTVPCLVITPYYSLVLVIFALMLYLHALRTARVKRAHAIMSYLQQAINMNLPLSGFIDAASEGEEWVLAKRLRELGGKLAVGMPLGQALEQTVPEISVGTTVAITTAENLGLLKSCVNRICRENLRPRDRELTQDTFLPFYIIIMGYLWIGTISGFMIVIIPKFQEIFADFRTSLPPLTVMVMSISDVLVDSGLGLLIAIILIFILFWFIGRVWQEILWPKLLQVKTRNVIFDFMVWHCPMAQNVIQSRGLAIFFENMSEALQAGQPLIKTVDEIAQLNCNRYLQKKFEILGSTLNQGSNFGEAVRRANFPRIAQEILSNSERSNSVPGACHFLAQYYRHRYETVASLARAALLPLVIVTMAIIVGLVALAMFLPLVTLINSVTNYAPNFHI